MTLAKDTTTEQAEKNLHIFLLWWQKQYYTLAQEADGLPECTRLLGLAAHEYGHLLHSIRVDTIDVGGRGSSCFKEE